MESNPTVWLHRQNVDSSAPGTSGDTSKLEVLLVLFPGFNTLDMNGPFDVLSKSGTSTSFNLQIASESTDRCGITRSTEGVKVQVRFPSCCIALRIPIGGACLILSQHDLQLDDVLIASLHRYDVLVVPGGSLIAVSEQASRHASAFMRLIAAFSKLPQRPTKRPRVLL